MQLKTSARNAQKRDEGLRMRVSRRKEARVETSTAPGARLRAQIPSNISMFNSAFDQTADGRVLKVLVRHL